MARLIFAAFGVFLCAAPSGCAFNNAKVVKISLTPNVIAVDIGSTVVLEAIPDPAGHRCGWQYQWQQIIDESTNRELITTNIPGATADKLILKNVQVENADLYRCLIYLSGIRGETNYTTMFSLQVSSGGGRASGVTTTVSGPFQPGYGSGFNTNCYVSYQDGMVFKNSAGGNWWLPQTGSQLGGKAIITANPRNDYSVPVYLEIYDEHFNSQLCEPLPWSRPATFLYTPNNAYMICLIFPGHLPRTGQQFSFSIEWQAN